MIIIVTIIIIIIIIPIHKSTTTIHTHHFKPKFTSPRFIAVVVFNSVGRFRASLLLCTTCVPDVIALLAVWWHNKPKTRPRPTGGASDIAENSGVDDRGAESLTSDISHFRANGKKTNQPMRKRGTHTHTHTHTSTHTHTHTHTHIHKHTHTHTQLALGLYACVYVCVRVCSAVCVVL